MLDTNIVSALVYEPRGKVYRKIQNVSPDRVCTSIIVTSEMKFGVAKRQSDKLSEQIDSVLSMLVENWL